MARLRRDERRWSSRPEVLVREVRSGCWVSPWDPTYGWLRKNPASLSWTSLNRVRLGLILTLFALAFLCVPTFGQTDVNDVHIDPRLVEKPPEAAKPDLLTSSTTTSTATTSTTGLSAHVRPLKVDVDLVLVPVTITDPMNRLVTGLDKENFQLFEGNATQQIRTFSARTLPSRWA